MLRANLKTAEGPEEISAKEKEFKEMIRDNIKVQEMVPGNECDYCGDCPNDIPISKDIQILQLLPADRSGRSRKMAVQPDRKV